MNVLYGTLLLAAFLLLCWLAVWDIGRRCDAAQHDVDVDELWDESDEWEVAA